MRSVQEPGGDRVLFAEEPPGVHRRRQGQSDHAFNRCCPRSRSSAGCISRGTPSSPGSFIYRVTPVFMNALDELSYGEAQEVAIELRRETYPGQAQRRLHARLRVFAGVRGSVRRGGDSAAAAQQGRRRPDVHAHVMTRRAGGALRLDGLRSARSACSPCSTRRSPMTGAQVRVVALRPQPSPRSCRGSRSSAAASR